MDIYGQKSFTALLMKNDENEQTSVMANTPVLQE
jgi:hypothetical protein